MADFYDSPTFLGQKDRYMLGMSLPQVGLLVGVAFLVFILSLGLDLSTLGRLAVVIPVTVAVGVILFVRLAGLSLPAYLMSFLISLVRRPAYESDAVSLLSGSRPWLAGQVRRQERSGGGFGLFRRRVSAAAASTAAEQRKNELRAEADRQVVQGSAAVESWVADGVRSVLKGGG